MRPTRDWQAPIERLREHEAAGIIFKLVFRYGEALERGAMVTANRQRSRMRPLPLR